MSWFELSTIEHMYCDKCRSYYVYIVETARGNFYTGISKNVERRVHDHNHTNRGAKALRGQRPVKLLWAMDIALTKSQALRFEHTLKQLSRADKLKFIRGDLPLSII